MFVKDSTNLFITVAAQELHLRINRIPITQYHTNSVYSRSISVIALLLTNQLPITLYCTPTSAKKCNRHVHVHRWGCVH